MKDSTLPQVFTRVLDSAYTAIEPLCKELADLLNKNRMFDQVFIADLLLREAFANGAHHGNKLSSLKKVTCTISLSNEMLEIDVSDEGDGFDWRTSIKNKECNELNECGRGISICRLYADEVAFNDTGSKIIIKKRIDSFKHSEISKKSEAKSEKDQKCLENEILFILNGNLIAENAEDIRKILLAEIQKNNEATLLVIDFKMVQMIDSRGMAILLLAYKAITQRKGRVRLIHMSKIMKDLFISVNLDRHFDIIQD